MGEKDAIKIWTKSILIIPLDTTIRAGNLLLNAENSGKRTLTKTERKREETKNKREGSSIRTSPLFVFPRPALFFKLSL